jgi:starch phosphorylase
MNIANMGKFSSDRTILEYSREVWNLKPCPVEMPGKHG